MKLRRFCPPAACCAPVIGVCLASTLMSGPAMKALSPAPVRIATRTSSSVFTCSKAVRSSCIVLSFKVFRTEGLLTVIKAMPSFFSNRRFSNILDYLGRWGRHVQAFDVRRAPGEDCLLIDVTFVRNFAGIDRRRFLEKKSTPGKARGSAAIGLKPGEAFTHARANPFIRNKCRNRRIGQIRA